MAHSKQVNQVGQEVNSVEAKLQKFFQLSEDLACILDQAGKFQEVNFAWQEKLGWTIEELRSQSWLDLVHPQDRTASESALPIDCSDPIAQLQNRYRHKDGNYRVCSWRLTKMPDGLIYGMVKEIGDSAELEDKLKLYQQALEAATCGVTIADLSSLDLPIIYCNHAFENITGYSKSEVIGRNCRFLQTTETDPVSIEQIRICLREGINCQVILKNKRKDGTTFWNELTLTPVRDNEGQISHYIGVQTDVTHRQLVEASLQRSNEALAMRVETHTTALRKLNHRLLTELVGRKRAEAALIDSEARLRAIFERATLGICHLDLEGQIVESNPTMQQILDYSAEEMLSRHFTDFLHPDEVESESAIYADLVAGELDYYQRETRYLRSNGQIVWGHLTISLVRNQQEQPDFAIAMVKNITEHRNAELALRLTQSMLDRAAVAAFLVSADGLILYANETAALSLGYPRFHLRNLTIHDIDLNLPSDLWAEHWGMLKEFGYLSLESRYQTQEGETFPVEITENYLEFQGEEYGCIFALDITERHQAEADVREALLKEKELNELRSRFITTISHQYRTPLTTVQSSAELLGQYGHLWPEPKKNLHVQRIQIAVEQMTQLLDDVLTLGAVEVGQVPFQPTAIDVVKFCQELCQEMKYAEREPIRPRAENAPTSNSTVPEIIFTATGECGAEQYRALMDRHLLRHILINILDNALKYSPFGGEVRFNLTCDADTATFCVQDSGFGIPEEDRAHIFELFHRASNVGSISGTGLGLSIVKKAVDLHGGAIAIESQVGVGTTVTVSLPCR